MINAYFKLSRHVQSLTGRDLHVQTRWVINPTAKTQVIVRDNGFTWSWGVHMSLARCQRLVTHVFDPICPRPVMGERLTE